MIIQSDHTGFPAGTVVKNLPASAGGTREMLSIPGLGRSPGVGHGNPLQYPCLENPHGQSSLVGFSPYGDKSWMRLKRLSTHTHQCMRCKRHGFDPWVRKIPWSRKWQPDCQENFKDRGAWWAAVHGVTKSQIQLSTCDHTVEYYTAMKMKHTQYGLFFNLKMNDREFPGGPVVRILGFYCRGHRFNPCSAAKKIRNE